MDFFPAYGTSVALSVIDYKQRPVIWSEYGFTSHVQQHPDRAYLESYLGVIEETIQRPDRIGVGKGKDCEILYSDGLTDHAISQKPLYMQVVVTYHNCHPARVKTALLTASIRGTTMVYSG